MPKMKICHFLLFIYSGYDWVLVKVTLSNTEHRKWNLRYIRWIKETVIQQI